LKDITLEELKEMVSSEYGYTTVPEGTCDSGNRLYGVSDDGLIELCYDILKGKR
jgi:hypothetical protein